jgi:hypothetical protein
MYKYQVEAEARAAKLGATIEWSYERCILDAPPGMVWDCDTLHALVCDWSGSCSGRRESFRDLWSRVEWGLVPCEEEGCYCKAKANPED